jgi:uncharacterized protein (TIGR02246 family)
MRFAITRVFILSLGLGASALFAAEPSRTAAAQDAQAEKAVRATLMALEEAVGRQNAKAVAALWAPDGDYIGPRGQLRHGREEIEQGFARFFAANPGVKLSTTVTSLRLVGDDVAVVEGITEVTPPLAGPPVEPRTNIVLARRDGKWLIESASDTLGYVPSNYEHLKALDWMIGDWKDVAPDTEGTSVESSCAWTTNKNFIIRKFAAKVKDRPAVQGTQVIGWDPRQLVIRSWTFDSAGGIEEGVWRHERGRWVIETAGLLQDGSETSATNVLTPDGSDECAFSSTHRMLNGQPQPDIPEITIRRVGAAAAAGEKAAGETILP